MPKLVFIGDHYGGRVYHYDLVTEKTTVGRGERNMLVIRDRSVSQNHCEILVWGPEVIIRDLDSSNGTYVDGLRLNKQVQVKSGQIVRFGSVEARLELELPSSGGAINSSSPIHELNRIMRKQAEDWGKPRPAPPSMEINPSPIADPGQDTVIAPALARPDNLAPPAPGKPECPPTKMSGWTLLIIVGAAALSLVVILWLFSGSK